MDGHIEAQTCHAGKAGSRLRSTFNHASPMDPPDPYPDVRKLISALLLEAGRIMEDASPDLALSLPPRRVHINQRLASARQAGHDIAQLMAAAEVLQRLSGDG